MFHNSKLIDFNSLLHYDNLYLINTIVSFNEFLHLSTREEKKTNEISVTLWHKRVGHIFRRRIKKLVSYEIFDLLNFADFDNCVNCINGKQINKRKFETNRSLNVLKLIYIDICGSFFYIYLEWPTIFYNVHTRFFKIYQRL